jgi:hypothetical protein
VDALLDRMPFGTKLTDATCGVETTDVTHKISSIDPRIGDTL